MVSEIEQIQQMSKYTKQTEPIYPKKRDIMQEGGR